MIYFSGYIFTSCTIVEGNAILESSVLPSVLDWLRQLWWSYIWSIYQVKRSAGLVILLLSRKLLLVLESFKVNIPT